MPLEVVFYLLIVVVNSLEELFKYRQHSTFQHA